MYIGGFLFFWVSAGIYRGQEVEGNWRLYENSQKIKRNFNYYLNIYNLNRKQMEKSYLEKIKETADYIRKEVGTLPKIGVILGTGLGDLVNHIEIVKEIDYHVIPNFPVSTVEGHSGKLIFGNLGGKYIMAMQGRFHYYEGIRHERGDFPCKSNEGDRSGYIVCQQCSRRYEQRV